MSSSLDSLIKNLSKDDFKYLRTEFDTNILDLVVYNMGVLGHFHPLDIFGYLFLILPTY